MVTRPTRISENSASIIDHILTNSNVQEHETFIICSKLSDHFPVAHQLNFAKIKQQKITFETRSLTEHNINKFKAAIRDYNWTHVSNQECAQEATNNFLATFDALFNAFFPITVKKFNKSVNPSEPWMSHGVLISRKRKNKLCNISLKKPNAENKQNFKTYRNLYNQVIRTAKKLHFERELSENQKNLRKTWQILFSSINKGGKKKQDLSHLIINGDNVSNPLTMAPKFNEFFMSIAKKTVENINPSPKSPVDLIQQSPSIFKFSTSELTKLEVLNASKLLANKKPLIILVSLQISLSKL